MHGSRLMTGAGYALKVPAIDLAEVVAVAPYFQLMLVAP